MAAQCTRRIVERTSKVTGSVILALLGLAISSIPAFSQDHQHADPPRTNVKAAASLSADELAGLLEGRGMGQATPAEVNGIPGPKHVLELADSLQLTTVQRTQTEALFRVMQDQAQKLGAHIVDAESSLQAGFAANADGESLRQRVTRIAALRGELRWAHLETHLKMAALLSAQQRRAYARSRGHGHHDQ